jgi:hypothetical protein
MWHKFTPGGLVSTLISGGRASPASSLLGSLITGGLLGGLAGKLIGGRAAQLAGFGAFLASIPSLATMLYRYLFHPSFRGQAWAPLTTPYGEEPESDEDKEPELIKSEPEKKVVRRRKKAASNVRKIEFIRFSWPDLYSRFDDDELLQMPSSAKTVLAAMCKCWEKAGCLMEPVKSAHSDTAGGLLMRYIMLDGVDTPEKAADRLARLNQLVNGEIVSPIQLLATVLGD